MAEVQPLVIYPASWSLVGPTDYLWGTVSFRVAQGLTATQQGQARSNLGLGAAALQGVATAAQAAALKDNTVDLTPATVGAAIAAYFASLPTTLPSTSGQLWWDGGTLSMS